MTLLRWPFGLLSALFLGGLAVASSAAAQPPIVITSAVIKPSQVSVGGKGSLVVSVSVASKFHINANKPNDPDLIPTTIKATGPATIRFGVPVYPTPQLIHVSYEKQPMLVYQARSIIVVPFTVAKSAKVGALQLKAVLSYQGCNPTSCYPPTSVSMSAIGAIK